MILLTKLKKLFQNKLLVAVLIGIFLGYVVLPYIFSKSPVKLEATLDESLPYHIWISLPYKQQPYIEFPVYFDTPYFRKDRDYLVKILACDEGHYLKVDENKNYYCDGKFLGKAVDTDKKGNPVKNFVFNGIIPQGKCFVLGTHKRSYDSRYFGFIDKNKIIKYMYPVY